MFRGSQSKPNNHIDNNDNNKNKNNNNNNSSENTIANTSSTSHESSTNNNSKRLFQNLRKLTNPSQQSVLKSPKRSSHFNINNYNNTNNTNNNNSTNNSNVITSNSNNDSHNNILNQSLSSSISESNYSIISNNNNNNNNNSNSNNNNKLLNKKKTLNQQNLSQYVTSNNNSRSDKSPELNHSRTQSIYSQSLHSQSRRSSSLEQNSSIGNHSILSSGNLVPNNFNNHNNNSINKLTRETTAQSSNNSIVSHNSHGSSSNLSASSASYHYFVNYNKYLTQDGNFKLEMPNDPHEVESLFEDIMYKRNIFPNLPQEKRQELLDYDINKKWMIVKQDISNELKKKFKNNKTSKTNSATNNSFSNNSNHTSSHGNSNLLNSMNASSILESQNINELQSINDPKNISSMHTLSKKPSIVTLHSKKLHNINTDLPKSNSLLNSASSNTSKKSKLTPDKTSRQPIHYVKKIIANTMSNDEMNDLWVTLRTEQLDWVDSFIDHQGHLAMANVLMKSLYKINSNPVKLTTSLLDMEQNYFKCFKVLSMLTQGLVEFSKHKLMNDVITRGLFSSRLNTRKTATEILVCMLNDSTDNTFEAILSSLDQNFKLGSNIHMINNIKTLPQYFTHLNLQSHLKVVQAWLFAIDQTLDGRGKMGSLVGASDDFRRHDGENSILEYCQWSLVFINKFCLGSSNINQRMLLRTKLENCGLMRIINKMQLLDFEKIKLQIENYENGRLDDFNLLLEHQNKHSNLDLQNPLSLLNKLWESCKGTENEKLLITLMQHLFLSSNRAIQDSKDPQQLSKQLKLIDSLVTNVGSSAVATTDGETTMNVTIQKLYDAMQTDEVARRAILESRSLTKKLEEVQADRDALAEKLDNAGNGLVGQLKQEIEERDRILAKNQRVTKQLENEFEELKKKHLMEKHEQEVELRKMLTIVNSRPIDSKKKGSVGELSSKKQQDIQKALQAGLQRTKKDFTKDAKKYGMTVQPNKRLQMLRMKMEDIENQARQLEMTNFADFENEIPEEEPILKIPKKKKKKSKHNQVQVESEKESIKKLNELRDTLAALQAESNEVTKFNVEQRVNELFNEKKLKALQRLKDLETKFKDLNINFNMDEIITATENVKDDTASGNYSSLDPKQSSNFDEITRLTNELMLMHDKIKKQQEDNEKQGSTTISNSISDTSISKYSSSTESSSESDNESDAVANDDENRMNHSAVAASSFLDSLSKKYGTGQKHVVSPTTANERTFMDRLRKPSEPAFLAELNEKFKPESIANAAIDKDISSDHMSGDPTKSNIASSSTKSKPYGNMASSDEDVVEHSAPIDDTEKEFFEDEAPNESTEVASPKIIDVIVPASDSSAPPPPPPPPPLPSLFKDFAKIGDVSSEVEKQTSPSPAPPPPPPPGFLGGSSTQPPPPPLPATLSSPNLSSNSTHIPPPPPMMFSKSASPIASPLLNQSSSGIFEKYPRPQKKLKQLHWEKLDSTDNSIWSSNKAEEFADDLYEKGVLSELESAFAAREIKSLNSKKKEDLNKISFLSRDISQQFGINLHAYSSLPVNELVSKILKCDRDILQTPSIIEFLSKPEIVEVSVNLARSYSPYTVDWEGVRNVEDVKPPEKDPNELQRADQLYLHLMVNLQAYWASRMRAIKVITTYEKEYDELLTKLRKIDKAIGALQDSENLRNVFNVILAVGNYMNDTSKQAQGFKIATLQRLTFIKDSSNSMTFLNYVEKIVRHNYPQLNQFLKELEPLMDVVKISVEQMVNDCKEYGRSIINVERSIEIGNLSDSSKFHPLDRVLVKTLPVLPDARKKGDLLDDEVKLTMIEFSNLMQTYGEDADDKFAKDSFFKKFVDFITEYKKAQEQNLAAEEEEKIYEKHKKMIEEQQRKVELQQEKLRQAANEESGEKGGESQDRRAVMDKLLEQLKNTSAVKSDPSSARKRASARKRMNEDKRASLILHDLENESDSIIYSPDTSTKSLLNNERESPSPGLGILTSPSGVNGGNDENVEHGELQDRAKTLLMELRGDRSPSVRNTSLDEHKEKIRARRKRNSSVTHSTSNKLSFFENETVLEGQSLAETQPDVQDEESQTERQQTDSAIVEAEEISTDV